MIDRAPTNDFAQFCLGRSLQMLGRHAEARKPLALAACCSPAGATTGSTRPRTRAAAGEPPPPGPAKPTVLGHRPAHQSRRE